MDETILLVDDEPDVVNLVKYNLHRAGYVVVVAESGPAALETARKGRPDLIVLDVMLPGIDGFEVCRQLRGHDETKGIPVIMLTAKGQSRDKITGFEVGADDYVSKPFSTRELVLRVEALLRRTRPGPNESRIDVDDFTVDRPSFEIRVRGERLDLTITEFKLLSLLIERRGRTLSRDTLLSDVWGYRSSVDTRTVDTHMRRLREKLGVSHSKRIETIRGMGYRFRAQDEPAEAAVS